MDASTERNEVMPDTGWQKGPGFVLQPEGQEGEPPDEGLYLVCDDGVRAVARWSDNRWERDVSAPSRTGVQAKYVHWASIIWPESLRHYEDGNWLLDSKDGPPRSGGSLITRLLELAQEQCESEEHSHDHEWVSAGLRSAPGLHSSGDPHGTQDEL